MNWLVQLLGPSSQTDSIRGGLALPRNKPGLPELSYIDELNLPPELVIPLLNYQRDTVAPIVHVGDAIKIGDPLAPGVIACVNGIVKNIEHRPIVHPSQRRELCVVIATEHSENNALEQQPAFASQDELTLDRIDACGIHGLGGAGFSTATKFQAGIANTDGINTLIINAVECEPMISCDEALMMTSADDIISAIKTLIRMTRCKRCILAIESDKVYALKQLQDALSANPTGGDSSNELAIVAEHPVTAPCNLPSIELIPLAPVYPSGAERPLIERLTRTRFAGSEKPVEHGIVCINVATALAAWRAQKGYPMISRIVTIAGERAQNPCNARVRFGTSIEQVLLMTGNGKYPADSRVRVGGPLSGFDIEDLAAPVTATSNCIAIEAPSMAVAPSPCIRCSACSDVCPVDLLPQQLYWYASAQDLNNCARFGLDRCIECGCCDVVCPSSIALTQTFRAASDASREQSRQAQLATLAEQRFEQREVRQAGRALLREEKRKAARARLQTNSNDPIADALKRAQKRRHTPKKSGSPDVDNQQSNGDSV